MKLAYTFAMLINMQIIEYDMISIHNLSTGPHKGFGCINDCGWKSLKVHFILS